MRVKLAFKPGTRVYGDAEVSVKLVVPRPGVPAESVARQARLIAERRPDLARRLMRSKVAGRLSLQAPPHQQGFVPNRLR